MPDAGIDGTDANEVKPRMRRFDNAGAAFPIRRYISDMAVSRRLRRAGKLPRPSEGSLAFFEVNLPKAGPKSASYCIPFFGNAASVEGQGGVSSASPGPRRARSSVR